MKRKIFAVAVVLGLIVMAGLSFQLSQSAGTHSSENSHQTSKVPAGGELHSEEAMDPNMPGMDHSSTEEATDPHTDEADAHTDEADAHTDEGMDPNMPGMDHSDPNAIDEETMDPDMPGMDHSDPNAIDAETNRPLKATLGTFGVATSIVLSGALILRQRDDKERKNKIEARKSRGETQ